MENELEKTKRGPGKESGQTKGSGSPGLIVLDGGGGIREIGLSVDAVSRLTIGSAPDNDIVLHSSYVSRHHGKIKTMNGSVYYADLDSTNGTEVEMSGMNAHIRGGGRYTELKKGAVLRIRPREAKPGDTVVILLGSVGEEGIWRHFPILKEGLKIGRDPENDLVLTHPGVSRLHAVIEKRSEGFVLVDQHSTNGIFVNSRRVTEPVLLKEKDVIRILDSTLLYTNGILYCKNQADGITIEVSGLSKVVQNNKQILHEISCEIDSNDFVAIIGGSGAGKTTFMNAISGYDQKNTGTVFYNGIDLKANFQSLKTLIGYVPQEDIIYENLTLKKMLYYTAKLKMGADSREEEIDLQIQRVLRMVELVDHQDTFIRKLSGGQKKRASIAVEMLAEPSVFFLDEPTSGLDPGTEQKLMMTLNRLSKSYKKTIIMVTHTLQSLELCDKVAFMGRGGRLCFFGSMEGAKQYFDTDDYVEIYNRIAENPKVWEEQWQNLSSREKKAPSGEQIEKKKGNGFFRQFSILTSRYIRLILNDAPRLGVLLAQPVLIALLLSMVADDQVFEMYGSTRSMLFALSCAGIWVGLFNSIQEICKERAILKREYMGNLRLSAYVSSKFFVQTILALIQAFLMSEFFLRIVGSPEKGVVLENARIEIAVTVFLTIEASMALGFVISSLVRSGDKAMTLAPFVLIIQLLFSGILFELSGAAKKIAYATISKWSVEALGSTADLNHLPNGPLPAPESEAFEAAASHIFTRWEILAGFVIVCALLCGLLLRRIARDSR